MVKPAKKLRAVINTRSERNNALYDKWSIIHIVSGIALSWVMPPFIAIALLVLYEPFEILILSPILARYDIVFGYETIRNSLSDVVFDTIGVIIGGYLLAKIIDPPFRLFF